MHRFSTVRISAGCYCILHCDVIVRHGNADSPLFNPFSHKLFLIVALWQQWVYQSVRRNTGLTHPFQFLTFGHSGNKS